MPATPESHRPKKSLGQNFLIDPNLQRKIVEAIQPSFSDEVLEIGPGTGALTQHLAGRAGRLTLVELDTGLARELSGIYAGAENVRVVQGDILDLDLETITSHVPALKVIGNIPYNITTPIIFHLLERPLRPRVIVLMIQREVADRILADAGSRTYGALAVGVQSIAGVERVVQVRRTAFRPAPNVDSTVVRITPFAPPRLSQDTEAALRTLTRAAFGHRRKQFQRILRDSLGLTAADLESIQAVTSFDLRERPETFSPEQFIILADKLVERGRL